MKSPFRPLFLPVKKVLRKIGIDVVRYNMHHSDDVLLHHIINYHGIKAILDVGANIGQYASQAIEHGYSGKIYSFEPIRSVYVKLESASRGFSQWQTYNLGVGSEERKMMINISENFVSSSFLTVGEASLTAEPTTRITHQEEVQITTLDSFFQREPVTGPTLLKLDVQGYEKEALKGAQRILPHVKLIQAELSYVENYKGGPLAGEIIDYLKVHGFGLFTIMPGFREPVSGRMLQADGIFIRQ